MKKFAGFFVLAMMLTGCSKYKPSDELNMSYQSPQAELERETFVFGEDQD